MDESYRGGKIVWNPTSDYIDQAHLTRFMKLHNLSNYAALMQRSTMDIPWFTEAILNYLDIQFYQPYHQVLDLTRGIAWPQWCIGGKMNIVHNCLDKYINTDIEDHPAIISEREDGSVCTYTYHELWSEVNQVANALRSLGYSKGDPIAIFMPMTCEIVVAMLAIAKIGGIILPLFSGFGSGALATRLDDAEAKAIFTVDGFMRRGKPISIKPIVDEAALDIPTLKHVIVLNYIDISIPISPGRDIWWHDLIPSQPTTSPTEITDSEDTLMIIYTSGTTGRPKGAVHTHCGFPVKAAQDMAFGTDFHPGHILYWITDMGWMMGPWLVFGALILNGTFFLYDGAPDFPAPDRIWSMVEKHKITTLGLSPTLLRSLIPHGIEHVKKHDLSSLRYFASTGEPWNPDSWNWLFEKVGEKKLPIINYSGGTEISGGIVMGNPLLPLKPCAFSGPCPGIAADVFDENGKSICDQVGELVIKAPWIGMTRGFWKDPHRYIETYWSRWQDIWVHGDFATITADGMWYILGRSDDTIKIAGKRIGPAEIESILVEHPLVIEAAAIAIPDQIKGNELVVFCVLIPGSTPSDLLRAELKMKITQSLGKALAARNILFVTDLPKTRNSKVMRRVIRSAYLDQDPGDLSALVNPDAIDEIKKAI